MIPLNEITGSSLDALFVYMALLGILLLAASWLRLKIPLLKKYYIPASLIAGVIGLILGPYFLGIIPKEIMSVWSGMSRPPHCFDLCPDADGKKAEKR